MRLSLLAACATVLAFGCGKDKPDSGPPPGGPAPTPTPSPSPNPGPGVDLATAKPDHTATAADWHAEFKKDTVASKKKYAGKVVELTGTLASFAENPEAGVLFAHLKIEMDVLGVRCAMSDPNAWEKAVEGAVVTVRGKLASQELPPPLMAVDPSFPGFRRGFRMCGQAVAVVAGGSASG